MFLYLIAGLVGYAGYNIHKIWDDIVSYYEMKTEEYTRIYTYDSYDLNMEDDESKSNPDISPFEDNIYMNCAVSILDRFRQDCIQKVIGVYFNALTLYCAFENEWIKMTKTNHVAYSVHCVLRYFGKSWKRITCGYLIEPESSTWVDTVSLYRVKQENGKFVYNINESYICNPIQFHDVFIEMRRGMERKPINPINENIPVGIIEVIARTVLGKCTDNDGNACYIVSQVPEKGNITKSSAKFMSVEYLHPQMEDTIPLELPNEMLISGNVLLTNTFVLRSLLHQPKPFIFDMDYKVKIVDSMVSIFELKSHECIVLAKDGYSVKNIGST